MLKLLRRYWTATGCTQHVIEHPVEEELRGGFTLRVSFVHYTSTEDVMRLIGALDEVL